MAASKVLSVGGPARDGVSPSAREFVSARPSVGVPKPPCAHLARREKTPEVGVLGSVVVCQSALATVGHQPRLDPGPRIILCPDCFIGRLRRAYGAMLSGSSDATLDAGTQESTSAATFKREMTTLWRFRVDGSLPGLFRATSSVRSIPPQSAEVAADEQRIANGMTDGQNGLERPTRGHTGGPKTMCNGVREQRNTGGGHDDQYSQARQP